MTIDLTLTPCAHHASLGMEGWCNDCVHARAVSDRKRTAELERKLAVARDGLTLIAGHDDLARATAEKYLTAIETQP